MKFNGNTPPYKLNKFVYAFKLNQMVRAASLSEETKYEKYCSKYFNDVNKEHNFIFKTIKESDNQPIKIYCSQPILAIKKRKVWLKQFVYKYNSNIPCIECKFYGYIFLYIE
jgi:hypothetical protein